MIVLYYMCFQLLSKYWWLLQTTKLLIVGVPKTPPKPVEDIKCFRINFKLKSILSLPLCMMHVLFLYLCLSVLFYVHIFVPILSAFCIPAFSSSESAH